MKKNKLEATPSFLINLMAYCKDNIKTEVEAFNLISSLDLGGNILTSENLKCAARDDETDVVDILGNSVITDNQRVPTSGNIKDVSTIKERQQPANKADIDQLAVNQKRDETLIKSTVDIYAAIQYILQEDASISISAKDVIPAIQYIEHFILSGGIMDLELIRQVLGNKVFEGNPQKSKDEVLLQAPQRDPAWLEAERHQRKYLPKTYEREMKEQISNVFKDSFFPLTSLHKLS